jgi:hypothetical protein
LTANNRCLVKSKIKNSTPMNADEKQDKRRRSESLAHPAFIGGYRRPSASCF